jgi:mannose-6-phosphate isomerase
MSLYIAKVQSQPPKEKLFRIQGSLKNYDWGSTTFLPDFLGLPRDDQPYAEIWFGTHASGPSQVSGRDSEFQLDELIKAHPEEILGQATFSKYGSRLPFLFKFLAIENALSVQVHPSLQEARAGFERENALGIDLSSPQRVYVDEYDKPEQICAISKVWALCGFRSNEEIAALTSLLTPTLILEGENPGDKFLSILQSTGENKTELLAAVHSVCANDDLNLAWQWVSRLYQSRPDDVTVIAPLFMNIVNLKPMESLFLEAGTIHAYLSGFAAEAMGASDNVIRAGLTSKHIAIAELAGVLNTRATEARVLTPTSDDDGWKHWESRSEYFKLSLGEIRNSELVLVGPAMATCLDGNIQIQHENEILTITRGESAFISGAAKAKLSGSGDVIACSTNAASDAK